MPKAQNGEYVLASGVGVPGKGRHWGQPAMVRHLILVAKEWRRRHPKGPVLRIGDISKFGGGHFPPHKTHQDGLAVDITTRGPNICHITHKNQDTTRELAELFVAFGAKQILYNHKSVIDAVPIVRKWPKHDDHFHVVVDPKKVPADGAPVLVPARDSSAGALIGRSRLNKKGEGPSLNWTILGSSARVVAARVRFDDLNDENGLLHDSGFVTGKKTRFHVPLVLKEERDYRWRLDLKVKVGSEEELLSLDWMALKTDLTEPVVTAESPINEDAVDQPVDFGWKFEDKAAVSSYRIELAKNDKGRGKKVVGQGGAATRHRLRMTLKPGRVYWWRIVARDAAGNEGASYWEAFKVNKPSKSKRPTGSVTASSLNVRLGPGTSHKVVGALKKGTEVTIYGEEQGWLKVIAEVDGKTVKGYVSKKFIKS